MKSLSKPKLFTVIAGIIVASVFYYLRLPALNIHSKGTWSFLITLNLIAIFVVAIKARKNSNVRISLRINLKEEVNQAFRYSKASKFLFISLAVLILVYFIGSLLSSPIFNSKAYHELMKVEQADFSEDIEQADFKTIPLMDKESASLIGDREMGSMLEMVSQYEVSYEYSQINVKGKPVRVSPLRYVDTIKWLFNMKNGIPGYVNVDMTTQDAEIIKLNKGIKYSSFEYFGRYIRRHLRFRYPTYIFTEQIFFEIDDEGTPYYVCPVKKFNIGLFGGETVGRVVLCNAVTGECSDYKINEVPSWVDKVYSAESLIRLYNYHGMLSGGYINSLLSQKGCLTTTNGYNYIAMNDDVWVYTGVTSAAADQAIVGFVLMNQRTMQTRFYPVEGVIEDSAMASAEGQVQHLGYKSTFPLLINIYGKPTYFMALKDAAGLVKKYALVSVEKYRLVAVGDSVDECITNYLKIPDNEAALDNSKEMSQYEKASGRITVMKTVVISGNTHYYIMLDNDKEMFELNLSNPDMLPIIKYEIGQTIHLEYVDSNEFRIVKSIKKR